MKPFCLLILTAILCWSVSVFSNLSGADLLFWRQQLMLVSGILLAVAMTWTVLLSVRRPLVDRLLGGLDQRYRLHRITGICAGVLAVIHLVAVSPLLWSVAGLTDMPGAHGVILLYFLIALVVFSLIRQIPFRAFRILHKLIPVVFCAGALHGLTMLDRTGNFTPLTVFTAFICISGIVLSVRSLAARNGRSARQKAVVKSVSHFSGHFICLRLKLSHADMFSDYQPGQFAYLRCDCLKGAHPFTVLSYDRETQEIEFAIKALGHGTRLLIARICAGDQVTVEGPYGSFTQPEQQGLQVWLAAGAGITPYIAWMNGLAAAGRKMPSVRMICCLSGSDREGLKDYLERLAELTGVTLILPESSRKDLHPDDIKALKPVGVWFCGPLAMRKAFLKKLAPLPVFYEHQPFR